MPRVAYSTKDVRELNLKREGHEFVISYVANSDASVNATLNELVRMVDDPNSIFDMTDAKVLASRMGVWQR